MSWGYKYRIPIRDRHNILWTSQIHEKDYLGGGFGYGLLYNWYAATDVRNICAEGWHVPTLAEWVTLQTYLGGEEVAGGKLKETGLIYWNTPNEGATNEVGFNARGAGLRHPTLGTFDELKNGVIFWCSTEDSGHGNMASIDNESAFLYLMYLGIKTAGVSIRPIKDDSTNTGTYIGNDGKNYTTVKIGDKVWLASNLCETKYRNGDSIPEVTGDAAWTALTTGALCAYNNDWNYAYSYTDKKGTGEPLVIEFVNSSDDLYDPIKSTRAIIGVFCYSMFALQDLYETGDMNHKVLIYQGDDLYWSGYVDPAQIEEPYGPSKHTATIVCADGLTILKNILYEESDGVPYTGYKLYSQIILDVLGKVGFTEFKEFLNIYEYRMNQTADDSPLDQSGVNVDVFSGKYCDEVLKYICLKFGAIVRQESGIYHFLRPAELKVSALYGRYFTAALTKTSVNYNPSQTILRVGSTTPNKQYPESIVATQRAAKKITIKQDYGNRESWIQNYLFDPETYGSGDFDYWTRESSTPVLIPMNNLVPGEDGIAYMSMACGHGYWLTQVFGIAAKLSDTDGFSLEFEYGFFNPSAGFTVGCIAAVEIRQGLNYLVEKDDTYAEWTPDVYPAFYTYPINFVYSAPAGWSGWTSYKRVFSGLESSEQLQISMGAYQLPTAPAVDADGFYFCIKNIRLYVSSYASIKKIINWTRQRPSVMVMPAMEYKSINTVQRNYVKTNAINGAELEYPCIIGDVTDTGLDNVLGQFKGASALMTAQHRVDKVTLTGSSGQCLITCGGIGRYAVWNTSLGVTAGAFVTANSATWNGIRITLTSSGADIFFTAADEGVDFYGDTFVSYQSGTLNGLVTYQTPAFNLVHTEKWNTRGVSENLPILDMIAEEMRIHRSRTKQLIDMKISEHDKAESLLKITGFFTDTLNLFGADLRAHFANRGTFNVKMRYWQLDFLEIEAIAIPEGGEGPVTADSTVITADSTTHTADESN